MVAQAYDASGNVGTSPIVQVNVNNGSVGPDTTSPNINISAPAAGAKLKGSVQVTANATDNVGVVGVQFLLDGANLGAEDMAAPFAINWDTTKVANKSAHNLTAKARDAAGNVKTSAVVSVTVDNSVVANPNAKFTWIKTNILTPRCVGCHSSYANYTTIKSKVSVGDPLNSTIYISVAPDTRYMPKNAAALSTEQVQALFDWITVGALNN